MEDIAIIETKDAVLVTKINQAQQVKELVSTLAGREELSHQREVYRPWGSYDSVDSGPNYQVKHISVNPCLLYTSQIPRDLTRYHNHSCP